MQITKSLLELKKIEQQEKLEALRLTETKELAEIWRLKSQDQSIIIRIMLEQCVWLSLIYEWNTDSQIEFHYESMSVICTDKSKNLKMVI